MKQIDTTEAKLISTAEMMFALKGIEGASMREINVGAGQRNVSALHYHFGSKAELIRAVFVSRLPAIDQRRLELLNARPGKATTQLKSAVEAMFLPLAELLGPNDEQCYYIRFLSQVFSYPEFKKSEIGSAIYSESYQITEKILLARLPVPVVRQRLAIVTAQVVHALADLEGRI